jgi:histidine ammonia-lyase
MTPARGEVVVGGRRLVIEEVVSVAEGKSRVVLSPDPEVQGRIAASVALLEERVASGAKVYGVTTGFGDSCDNDIGVAHRSSLAANLVRFHRCGTGRLFEPLEARAIVLARLASLASGYSAVRPAVLELLAALLNRGITPQIPSQGSVGASGDLTPLAYVAAALLGEGRVHVAGTDRDAAAALREAGLGPLELIPKESLALMNGTSAMAGLAVLGFERARRLARFAAALTAMSVEALRGEPGHFEDRIFELKPHPGQRAFARWVREDLGPSAWPRPADARLQDRYSIRCAPHVVGVLLDALPLARSLLEVEVSSVNDNPIVDPDTGRILHTGNFYGGHVGFVADTLKTCVANVADLLDRQLALLLSPVTSNGLPRDLVAVQGPDPEAHHGFKAMHIGASALTAEALKLTMPASAFSRSTENHNQDKVSMGTIGARDLLRVLDLTETVAVILLLALAAAVEIRGGPLAGSRAEGLLSAVRRSVAPLTRDRPMDADIHALLELYRAASLPTGEPDFG